jgi:hypothetical protein
VWDLFPLWLTCAPFKHCEGNVVSTQTPKGTQVPPAADNVSEGHTKLGAALYILHNNAFVWTEPGQLVTNQVVSRIFFRLWWGTSLIYKTESSFMWWSLRSRQRPERITFGMTSVTEVRGGGLFPWGKAVVASSKPLQEVKNGGAIPPLPILLHGLMPN